MWIIGLADVALMSRRHWTRLEPEERSRLLALARKSKGRPSKLSDRESAELSELLEKLGYVELAGGAVRALVPIPLAGKTTEFAVRRGTRRR